MLHRSRYLLQKRCFSFTSLTPRNLNDITNLPKLAQEEPETIKSIWEEFHKSTNSAIGRNITVGEGSKLMAKGKACPMFIFPVYKSKDSYLMLLTQFQDSFFLATYLEEYKKNPAAATPWLSMNVYKDLAVEKNIVLTRSDFLNNLTKKEANAIVDMICEAYTQDGELSKHVEDFNLRPTQFNFEKYLAYMSQKYSISVENNI